MGKEYVTFITHLEDLAEGREIVLTIRDLTPGPRKYDARIVRAIVSRHPERLPEADVLRVRSWTGTLYPQPWAIKITQEVGETPGRPHGEMTEERG